MPVQKKKSERVPKQMQAVFDEITSLTGRVLPNSSERGISADYQAGHRRSVPQTPVAAGEGQEGCVGLRHHSRRRYGEFPVRPQQ